MCQMCYRQVDGESRLMVARANTKALADISKGLLSSVISLKKGEPIVPEMARALVDELGGTEGVAGLIAAEYKKSCGEAELMTTLERENWVYSPTASHKWLSLVVEMARLTDEKDSIDIDALSHADLVDGLRGLAIDLVKSSPEFRRMMVELAIEEEPELAEVVLAAAGRAPLTGKVINGNTGENDLELGEAASAAAFED